MQINCETHTRNKHENIYHYPQCRHILRYLVSNQGERNWKSLIAREIWKLMAGHCYVIGKTQWWWWARLSHTRGRVWQKQVSMAGTSNYIPHILWNIIIWPCPWYFLLAHKSTHDVYGTVLRGLIYNIENIKFSEYLYNFSYAVQLQLS